MLPRLLPALDAVRLSVIGLVVVSLTAVQMYLGPLRLIRPSLTLLILVAGVIALRPKTVRWANLYDAWPGTAVAVFFSLAIGSAIYGLSIGGSMFFITALYWKVIVFFIVLTISIRHVRDLALLMWSLVISLGTLVVLSLTVLEMQQTTTGLGRLQGQGMLDANDIGMVMLMGIPLAVLLILNSSGRARLAAMLVLAGSPVTIAFTGSRGAMVGLAFVAPALFFALKSVKFSTRIGTIAVVIIALALGAPEGYWKQMGTIFDSDGDYNYSDDYGRMAITKRGIGYMLRFPVFGVGVANFPRAEGTISPIANERSLAGLSVAWIAPHNTYVQVGAEMGIPALIVWLGILFGGTVGLLRLRRRLPKSWEYESGERRFLRDACLFLPITYLAFAVTSFFLTHAYTTPVYILLAMTTGILVLSRRELRRDRRHRGLERERARRPAGLVRPRLDSVAP